jgi:hypothetical protein
MEVDELLLSDARPTFDERGGGRGGGGRCLRRWSKISGLHDRACEQQQRQRHLVIHNGQKRKK